MDKARVREIAKLGAKALHEQGKAHQWTSDEARIAGRKGGNARTLALMKQRAGLG